MPRIVPVREGVARAFKLAMVRTLSPITNLVDVGVGVGGGVMVGVDVGDGGGGGEVIEEDLVVKMKSEETARFPAASLDFTRK